MWTHSENRLCTSYGVCFLQATELPTATAPGGTVGAAMPPPQASVKLPCQGDRVEVRLSVCVSVCECAFVFYACTRARVCVCVCVCVYGRLLGCAATHTCLLVRARVTWQGVVRANERLDVYSETLLP